MLGSYLNGDFGDSNVLSPKVASVLFAMERMQRKNVMIEALKNNDIIILDRYISSNKVYQGAMSEEEGIIPWIDNLEYNIMEEPREDITIFLDVPVDISRKLVLQKKQREYTKKEKDIYEKRESFAHKVYAIYKKLSKKEGWIEIDCIENGKIREMEDIQKDIINRLF